jgi:DNA segregation ATPase FtsK/SpoIIIE-like protein
MQTAQFREYATAQIITKPMDPFLEYTNPNIKPYEMYLGVDFAGEPIKNNMNQNCMVLVAGATGSGKTRWLYCVILSWILSCRVNEVEIYLSDIAKTEYVNFQNVKLVRRYAEELPELHSMMKALDEKIQKRKNTIKPLRERGQATNIEEYNRVSKVKLSYCYLIIDEFSIIIPDKTDTKEESGMKTECLDILKRISKIGRSLGVFCVIATQKTTRDEIPSIIKNMSAVRISFRANDLISSEVILGSNAAVGLSDRYAVYSLNGGSKRDYLYSPYITTARLKELLKPYETEIKPYVVPSKEIKAIPLKAVKNERRSPQGYEIINLSDYEIR